MGFTGTYHGDIRPSTKISDIFNSQLPSQLPSHIPERYGYIGFNDIKKFDVPLNTHTNGLTLNISIRTLDPQKTIKEVFNDNRTNGDNHNIVILSPNGIQSSDKIIEDTKGLIRFQIFNNIFRFGLYYNNTDAAWVSLSGLENSSIISGAISLNKLEPLCYMLFNGYIHSQGGGTVSSHAALNPKSYVFTPFTHIYIINGLIVELYLDNDICKTDDLLAVKVNHTLETALSHRDNKYQSQVSTKEELNVLYDYVDRNVSKTNIFSNIEIRGYRAENTNHTELSNHQALPIVIPKNSTLKNDRTGTTIIIQIKPIDPDNTIASVDTDTTNLRLFTLSETGRDASGLVAVNRANNNNILFCVYQGRDGNNWTSDFSYGSNNVISVVMSKKIGVLGTKYFLSGLSKSIVDGNISYTYNQTSMLNADSWPDIQPSKYVFLRDGYLCRIVTIQEYVDNIDIDKTVRDLSYDYINDISPLDDNIKIRLLPSMSETVKTSIASRLAVINNEEYSMDYILELLTT